jgi:hypothetical protein
MNKKINFAERKKERQEKRQEKLEIIGIEEYASPSSVCYVEVRRTFTENKKTGDESVSITRQKSVSCHVRLNHDYVNGRFVPKGEPSYYQVHEYRTPVCSVIPNGNIATFVTEELERKFQEQRAREGW